MATQMYVNLPVKDLGKSIEFFTKLGFKFNAQFTDDKATCMVIGTDSFVMLVADPYFKTFTPKAVADARKGTEVILSVTVESKEKVNDLIRKSLSSGGQPSSEAKDYGWMYQHGFQDPDGHLWEVIFMDMSKVPKQVPQEKQSRDIL